MGLTLGAAAVAAAPTVIGWIDSFVKRLVANIPDPAERARVEVEARAELMTMVENSDQRQSEINREQAASPSLFVGGARPAAMWVCVAGLAYDALLSKILPWVFTVAGLHNVPPMPPLGDTSTELLLWSLLGLGGMRSFDKIRGTDLRGPFGPSREPRQ